MADVIYDEQTGLPAEPVIVDPLDPTRRKRIAAGTPAEDLLVPVMRGGRTRLRAAASRRRGRARRTQLAQLHPGIKRFVNPHQYPVGLALELHELQDAPDPRAREACGERARIYLDHNATTPLDPRVLEAMLPWLRDEFGNPSSLHWFGQRARAAVEEARSAVAALVGAEPAEIVFTAGGSEADNPALRGAPRARRRHAAASCCTAIEHHAVLNTAKALRDEGGRWPSRACARTGRSTSTASRRARRHDRARLA